MHYYAKMTQDAENRDVWTTKYSGFLVSEDCGQTWEAPAHGNVWKVWLEAAGNEMKAPFEWFSEASVCHAEDGYFFGYSDVETFTCTNNKITTFPDIFNAKSIYIMGSLDFSYNQISSFENGDDFRGVNTGQLNLSNNHLTQFPGILFKKRS